MRARWMDPTLGRFISEDPARDGANWFEYCRGNPVNAVDPDGRSYVSVLTGLYMALGLLVGQSIGYLVTSWFIQAINPGYSAGVTAGGILFSLGSTLAAFAVGLGASRDDLLKGNMSIAAFAKGLARALARDSGAGMRMARMGGLAFVVGLIVGCSQAVYEYYASDYYANH